MNKQIVLRALEVYKKRKSNMLRNSIKFRRTGLMAKLEFQISEIEAEILIIESQLEYESN